MSTEPRTAHAREPGTMRRISQLLQCIRFDEVLVLQGTPMLGALFAMGQMTSANVLVLVLFALASCCLVAHVFLLNDWSGAGTDVRDPSRAERVFTVRGVSSGAVGTLCASLLVLSIVLLAPFGPTPILLALTIAILSALYSAPRFAMKGVPLAGTALHLIGGLVHFLLGYSVFHTLDGRSLAIGGFFALVFAAGHLTHEARDSASDRLNEIRTNAVAFGPASALAAGFLLFSAANILLVALAARQVVPRILIAIIGLYPLHFWWTLDAWKAGLGFEDVQRLKQRYRILYAIIGVAMALATRLAA